MEAILLHFDTKSSVPLAVFRTSFCIGNRQFHSAFIAKVTAAALRPGVRAAGIVCFCGGHGAARHCSERKPSRLERRARVHVAAESPERTALKINWEDQHSTRPDYKRTA